MFDHQPFRSAGELTVQSPGSDQVSDRYYVRLTGGVNKVVVDTAMPPEMPAAPDVRRQDRDPQSLADLPASRYPNIVALAGQIMNPSMDDRFRFGLKILLDGLERRLKAR